MRTISFSTSPSSGGRPGNPTYFRAIELARDQPSVPCQDRIRQGRIRHLAKHLAAQSTADLAELRSLGVREPQPALQLGLQNSVFSSQILIPQEQLLVHRSRY